MNDTPAFLDYLAWRLGAFSIRPFERYLQFLALVRSGFPVEQEGLGRFPEAALALKSFDLAAEVCRYQSYRRRGYSFTAPGRESYPLRLAHIPDPPRGLFLWGDLRTLTLDALAVVGAREPSSWTLEWMEGELPQFLRAQEGVMLVSGGARGVDQTAHRLSLMQGRPTVIFLPSGFDEIYPSQLSEWVQPVLEKGGVFVTEYAPEMSMRKSYFRERNRLISGFAPATLILEAGRKSGTWLTAKAAAEQGRPLFVVPSHPRDSRYDGSLQLLSEGACLLRDAQELTAFFRAELSFSYCDMKESSMPSLQLSLNH